jgi:hypothetical protein
MSTWIFTNEHDELLTVPYLINGERMKRFVGVKSNTTYFMGKLTLSPKTKNEIRNEMLAPYKNVDAKRLPELEDRVDMLLNTINLSEFGDAAKAEVGATQIAGIKVLPVFAYKSVGFDFWKQKLPKTTAAKLKKVKPVVDDKDGERVKTVKPTTKKPAVTPSKAAPEKKQPTVADKTTPASNRAAMAAKMAASKELSEKTRAIIMK